MDDDGSVQFFNRYTGQVETERIYGENWLKWAYERPSGQLLLWAAGKRIWFSNWYGWKMNRPSSRIKIEPFCQSYELDTSEFEKPVEFFPTFNDFFSRRLKPDSRPIDSRPEAALFPVDGRHLGFQDISKTDSIYVKSQRFNLPELLADDNLVRNYRDGSLILSRLCPVDCHRFHFPASGMPGKTRLLNGFLFSVNPISLRKRIDILWQNKRFLTILQTDKFGPILIIEVGATCVGLVRQIFQSGKPVSKGAEKGYFRFGGSMVLTFFEKGRIRLDEDLLENSRRGLELFARMSDGMGTAASQGG